MYYQYYYEAKSIVGDISLHLDEAYAKNALIACILFSVLAFGLTLFTAIAIKKARPYGIFVAIVQPLGFIAAMKSVIAYGKIDFSCLEMKVTSQVSLDDAMNKLQEKLTEVLITDIFPDLVGMIPWLLITFFVFVITLIYLAILSKAGHGLAVFALIVLIIKQLCISAINPAATIFGMGDVAIQYVWDYVNGFFLLLPLILIAIRGLIVLISNKKASNKPQEPANDPALEVVDTATPVVENEAETTDEATAEAATVTEPEVAPEA